MEIKYPITVYSVGCDNTLHETTFEGSPKHHLDCHYIDKKKFIEANYDITYAFYLDRKEAIAELREQLEKDIENGERKLKRDREKLTELK